MQSSLSLRPKLMPQDFVQGALNALSLPFVLLSRRWGSWGDHYLSGGFVCGLFVPLVLLAFTPPMLPGRIGLLLAIPVMLFYLAIHAAHRQRRNRDGISCHREYAGTYWFQTDDSPAGRKRASFKNELIGFPLFLVLVPFSPALAVWLVVSMVADGLNLLTACNDITERIRRMDEARIEHEYLMRIYRGPRHGW
jgi:hypothetical protein